MIAIVNWVRRWRSRRAGDDRPDRHQSTVIAVQSTGLPIGLVAWIVDVGI